MPVDFAPQIVKAGNCSSKADGYWTGNSGPLRCVQLPVRCPQIAMMQSANLRQRNDLALCWRLKIGASWVHLRTCQTCGMTLCCDDSPNRHATKHAHASRHLVIASAEPESDGCIVILMMRLGSTRFWQADCAVTHERIPQLHSETGSNCVRMQTSER